MGAAPAVERRLAARSHNVDDPSSIPPLLRNGKISWDQLRRCNVAPEHLDVALRKAGCAGHHDIALAMLETSGEISIDSGIAQSNPYAA